MAKIRQLIPQAIIPRILAIQLPTAPCADVMVWPHTTSGHYSTKLGYRCFYDCHRQYPLEQGSPPHLHKGIHVWKSIWNLDLLKRTKVFIWKCVCGILAVKKGVYVRINQIPLTCPTVLILDFLF
ncbi:hypothetical protein RHGRI_014056 [Rhododendron griersonianum]|uniref:Reverse transcriptase zinc-binding domain-containing protein n=1 Tax=Rhododendron griersonianum TaxID=479676 RepID=A0AAV6K7W8_9ERIC|nr:hypothetical protein RHGRI_014056 [Rhododendron griersonianum]